MNRTAGPSRWALVVIAAATLALAGCGRKGGLDLPAGAADTPGSPAASAAPASSAAPSSRSAAPSDVFAPSYGTSAPPVAGPGQKKRIVLDSLLD
ncbi:lipoprotein [Rhodopseudomonas palustris]|uniref:LPS translocon maturation chaperone LptM n=1 Tax=Rhodopseudomonas palustris TaxID=1076 RepID=UPI0020CCB382|nr:lipoprotein [Rhodopseudomonas palustris]